VLDQLASIVTTLKANLGVAIDANGERLMVVDESGGKWLGAKLQSLFVLLIVKRHPGALLAVPVNSSSLVLELAKKHAAKVIVSRTDRRSLTHTALLGDSRFQLASTASGEFVFPAFSSGFDAMFAFAKLLELTCSLKKPLSEHAKEIPEIYLRYYPVACEISAKGRVMRGLLEKFPPQQVEVVDGVKVLEEGGWVLIVPHRSLPELQMWVEGSSLERLHELAEGYSALIQSIVAEGGQTPREIPTRGAVPAMAAVSEDRAFHFWVSGRYLGVKARTLREFSDTLHYVEADSLAYHLERGDFSNWLELELSLTALAGQVGQLRSNQLRGESLRSALLQLFAGEIEPGVINEGAVR